MKPALPKPLQQFILLMRIFGVIYALCAVVAFFFPTEVFYLMNVGPKVFKITEVIPYPSEHFWGVYATGMMAMLSALCFLASESPRIWGYSLVHLLAKVVTTLGFISMFMSDHRYFAYLLFAVIDGAIVILLVAMLTRISWSWRHPIEAPAPKKPIEAEGPTL
jgi:hypothetical protein